MILSSESDCSLVCPLFLPGWFSTPLQYFQQPKGTTQTSRKIGRNAADR